MYETGWIQGFLRNRQWSSVKGNTRTHLFQTEVLWPCSSPSGDDQVGRSSNQIQPDQTPEYSLFLYRMGTNPRNVLIHEVNENDDDFQYTLPSSPILDPVKLVLVKWSKDDCHIACSNYIKPYLTSGLKRTVMAKS